MKNATKKRQHLPANMTKQLQRRLVTYEFSKAEDYCLEYQECYTHISHFFKTRLRRVSELLADIESGKILDAGCGPAMICNTFRDKPIDYYGVDISEDMIRVCTDTFRDVPRFKFSVGVIEDLNFPDSYFDAVLCLGVFEYIIDGAAAVREIARVLKPKGTVIVSMHNKMSPYRIWQSYVYGKARGGINRFKLLTHKPKAARDTGSPKRAELIIRSETSLCNLLAAAGLETRDVVYYDFNLFFSPLDTLFPKASVYLSSKLEPLGRSMFKFIGTGFIVKCKEA